MASLPQPLRRTTDRPRILDVETRLRIYIAIDNQLRAKRSLSNAFQEMYNVITRGTRDGTATPGSTSASSHLLRRFRIEPSLAKALRFWTVRLRSGSQLGDAMTGWLPSSEANLIIAGERSKDLSSTFADLIAVVTQKQRIQDAVREAIAYPAMLLVATLGITYFLGVKVVPTIAANTNPASLTWLGRSVIAFSDAIIHIWPFMLGAVIAGVVAFFLSLYRWTGPLRARVDTRLPYSLYRLTEGLAVMRAYQVLTTSGTKALVALNLLRENASPYIRSRLAAIAYRVETGMSLGHAMDATGHHFPDDGLIENVLLLPEDEHYSRNLRGLIDRWGERSLIVIQKQAGILKVAGIVLIALVVLFIYAGINEMTSGLDAVAAPVR
jgi:type II secretory pathway component PulF